MLSLAEDEAPPEVLSDGPGKLARIVIWRDGPTQFEYRWASAPSRRAAIPIHCSAPKAARSSGLA